MADEKEDGVQKHAQEVANRAARSQVEPAARRALRAYYSTQGEPFSRAAEDRLVRAMTTEECGRIKASIGAKDCDETICGIVLAVESREGK